MVIAVALLTARLTLMSVQYGCTIALVVITVGLYARNRTAGLAALWLCWFLAPFVRRLFLLSEGVVGVEPLALAPFLITAIIAGLELQQMTLTKRLRKLLLYTVAGYALGIPLGFLAAPPAAAFAFFAYTTAAACMIIGYREGTTERAVLPRLLVATAPFLALYAFRQYYLLPLPEWDAAWRAASDFGTAGSSDQGRVRVWSTLNSPGTFASVMGVAALAYITTRRIDPWALVGSVAVLGALALTYVRSAWLALFVALIGLILVSRGGAMKRVAPLILVLAALGPVVLGGSTQNAITTRANTFGTLGTDTSGGDRAGSSLILIPAGLSQPIGTGIGQAGEATRLGNGGIRITDNGYLSLLLQVGPFGFGLILMAAGSAARAARRNAWRRPRGNDLLVFGVIVFSGVISFFGDQLYGIGGMIFWYAAGYAVGRDELEEATA
jgi:hypothetical protein